MVKSWPSLQAAQLGMCPPSPSRSGSNRLHFEKHNLEVCGGPELQSKDFDIVATSCSELRASTAAIRCPSKAEVSFSPRMSTKGAASTAVTFCRMRPMLWADHSWPFSGGQPPWRRLLQQKRLADLGSFRRPSATRARGGSLQGQRVFSLMARS